jgi:hypothetical protein
MSGSPTCKGHFEWMAADNYPIIIEPIKDSEKFSLPSHGVLQPIPSNDKKSVSSGELILGLS